MTRDGRSADVRALFDGTRWSFRPRRFGPEISGDFVPGAPVGFEGDVLALQARDGDRIVHIESSGSFKEYRVTRVIGGRTREDFAGVDLAGGREELVLPFSFVYATGALRYKGYSVMVHERATLRAGPVWSRTCIFCHNTVPELDRLVGALAGPHTRGYQGEQVDRWLPAARRADWHVTDPEAFARVAAAEMARLRGAAPDEVEGETSARADPRAVARRAVDVIRAGFAGGDLVEEGIGCEACHGGAREHTRDPRTRPSFLPTAPWLGGGPTPAGRAESQVRACARCHQVLFSRYPFTWEGGRRDAGAGGSHISSGEARDYLLGGCSTAMPCSTCHDPHGGDAPGALETLATPVGNAACASCHADLTAPERLRAHAHHDPSGPGGSCVGCHMPRKNMGLDGMLTRYHRIGSPTDAARVLGDRPLECALCHADATARRLVDAMEAWWPVRYPRQRLEELYGSLDANVLRATVERGRAHEQAVAMAVLGEARARDAAPLVVRQLDSEYPLVREWARRALDAMGVQPSRAASVPPTHRSAGAADEDPED